MADDFYGYDGDGEEPKSRDNLFLWTVFILLLIGGAFAAWMGSFYVFAHPENPKAYALLKKLKKVESPRRFEITAAPQGEYKSAQDFYNRYGKMTRLELERENAELLRNYIRNFRETKKLVPYLTGRYTVMDTYELKKSDLFPTGVVAVAQSVEFPQVLIEHVYTSSPRNVPLLRAMLPTGLEIKLERTNDLASIVHVEKAADGRMQFTIVPLLYGTYAVKQGSGTFSLEPPVDLNMEPGLPVVKSQILGESLNRYAAYKKKQPPPAFDPNAAAATPPPGPELVRLDTTEAGKPVPETGAMPAVPVATPVMIPGKGTPRPIAVATPRSTLPPHVAMLTTPEPRAFVPAVTPLPASATPLPRTSPDGVPLKPFIAAQPDRNVPTAGASWRTYSPGQAPPAKGITLADAPALAERGDIGEKLYLRGDFRVTANTSNRAVLRDANKSDDESPRVLVEYPQGAVPAREGDRFSRDASRPYLVTDVRRGADGVVTIYVKEIIGQ